MKFILPLALFLFFVLTGSAQVQDSTDIKLQHYKDLFVKGLISSQEYETLKAKTLGITQPAPAVQAAPVAQNHPAFNNDSIIEKGFCQITELGLWLA